MAGSAAPAANPETDLRKSRRFMKSLQHKVFGWNRIRKVRAKANEVFRSGYVIEVKWYFYSPGMVWRGGGGLHCIQRKAIDEKLGRGRAWPIRKAMGGIVAPRRNGQACHSGAMRSIEPGIHRAAERAGQWILRCAIAHHSSPLRGAPE
ncbi:hypothetical protein [Bradyrhizobium forestalis]|uniref:hypothetical protein n=1 Tax=Bradyrhizobium forestalis TaxID=1419263 RepID=UPI00142E6D9C|nr:hypothetical protein [Bradyrhizobium forestalis]